MRAWFAQAGRSPACWAGWRCRWSCPGYAARAAARPHFPGRVDISRSLIMVATLCGRPDAEGAMKIAVIGTGYVGLVTATCLAESGNDVAGVDKEPGKIATLKAGALPIYEPGLLELVQRNLRELRLSFTTDLPAAVKDAQLIFVAVGT